MLRFGAGSRHNDTKQTPPPFGDSPSPDFAPPLRGYGGQEIKSECKEWKLVLWWWGY